MVLTTAVIFAGLAFSQASLQDYKEGSTTLEGYVAAPAGSTKRPVVLIVHDWNGQDEYERGRARQIAELGYIGFAVDIYGKGVRPKNQQESSAEATKYYSDNALLRRRLQAAVDFAKTLPNADTSRMAIMGYCFGGSSSLEAARMGAPVLGAISFHGGLETQNPAKPGALKAKILVLHGADDPFVPADHVAKFQEEMRTAKADWQFVGFGNAVHSFTEPSAGNDNSRGAAYNADADRRSWSMTKAFLAEIFGR